MTGFIGSHFDLLAVGACVAFMIVLGVVSIGDALRRGRESRSREAAATLASPPRQHAAASSGQDEGKIAQASQAA